MNERLSKHGVFTAAPGEDLHGKLNLDGLNSLLKLWSDHPIDGFTDGYQTITGELEDGKTVTLLECIPQSGTFTIAASTKLAHKYRFVPLYAVVGNHPFDGEFSHVSFVIDDADILFFDPGTFGSKSQDSARVALQHLEGIPDIEDGANPVLSYWTGKTTILSGDMPVGFMAVKHRPILTADYGSVKIDNRIAVSVTFPSPLDARETEKVIERICRFFGILAGRPQNLLHFNVRKEHDGRPYRSAVYMNMLQRRPEEHEFKKLSAHTLALTSTADQPEEFSKLMSTWLKRDETWDQARTRFFTGWRKQRCYDEDRMVGAANAFDVIPRDAVPESSLKEKVRHRSRLITAAIGEITSEISEIDLVTDAAVSLRHYFVHGDRPEKQRRELKSFFIFLTDTLEFVFCASDLIESGWDMRSWLNKNVRVNSFGRYLRNYPENLARLKAYYSREATRDPSPH